MPHCFEHYLATRFNVATKFSPGTGLAPVWLDHRFQLFEQFCVPSVAAQTCQNFTWIIMMDVRTPPHFHRRLKDILFRSIESFKILPTGQDCKLDLRADLRNRIGRSASHLITSRLDNDDSLHQDFVRLVQERFSGQDYAFVSFANGYTYSIETKSLRRRLFPENPFLSLIEMRSERLTTIYCGNHSLLHQKGPMNLIDDPPGWLQVVHEKNVSNRNIGARVPRALGVLRKEFNVRFSAVGARKAPRHRRILRVITDLRRFITRRLRVAITRAFR